MLTGSASDKRGFTLVEMMMVVLILAISASLAVATISRVEAAQRPERAAREVLAALRFARMTAYTSGKTAGVQIDTRNQTLTVYRQDTVNNQPQYTPVSQPLMASRMYTIAMNTTKEIQGTLLTTSLALDTNGIARLSFTPFGASETPGSITCTYTGKRRIVNVPALGDPTIN